MSLEYKNALLTYAMQQGNIEFASELLKNGADIKHLPENQKAIIDTFEERLATTSAAQRETVESAEAAERAAVKSAEAAEREAAKKFAAERLARERLVALESAEAAPRATIDREEAKERKAVTLKAVEERAAAEAAKERRAIILKAVEERAAAGAAKERKAAIPKTAEAGAVTVDLGAAPMRDSEEEAMPHLGTRAATETPPREVFRPSEHLQRLMELSDSDESTIEGYIHEANDSDHPASVKVIPLKMILVGAKPVIICLLVAGTTIGLLMFMPTAIAAAGVTLLSAVKISSSVEVAKIIMAITGACISTAVLMPLVNKIYNYAHETLVPSDNNVERAAPNP